jgi:hypothetical protein
MYTELPSTERLWNLCKDIYTARQHGDFLLEEELYNILILVYRTPDVMQQMSQAAKQNMRNIVKEGDAGYTRQAEDMGGNASIEMARADLE